MAIAKRLRYEVLRRDNFTCRYCGACAPDVKLHVDAVTPEALGGSHKDPTNLVAACEPCNSGKSSSSPDGPLVADVEQDALRWARARNAAATCLLDDLAARTAFERAFDDAWSAWDCGGEEIPRPDDWWVSVDRWRAVGVPFELLGECIRITMAKKLPVYARWKYFCAVAWGVTRELDAATEVKVRARVLIDAEAPTYGPLADFLEG